MQLYSYEGPIKAFDKVLISNWKCETRAVSKEKALSNFKHKARILNGKVNNYKIELPGVIKNLEA